MTWRCFYPGNFDQYIMTREENEENQMKKFKWEQEQVSWAAFRRLTWTRFILT